MRFAALFFVDGDRAYQVLCRPSCLFRRHACVQVIFDFPLQVIAKLLIEFG
jgi:hypothetical protein